MSNIYWSIIPIVIEIITAVVILRSLIKNPNKPKVFEKISTIVFIIAAFITSYLLKVYISQVAAAHIAFFIVMEIILLYKSCLVIKSTPEVSNLSEYKYKKGENPKKSETLRLISYIFIIFCMIFTIIIMLAIK